MRRDYEKERSRRLHMLWKWRRRNGSDATHLVIITIFLQMENRLLAELVLKTQSCEITSIAIDSHVNPERVSRYGNWEALNKVEKEQIINTLISENEIVRAKFAFLSDEILISFEQRAIPVDRLKLFIVSYGVPLSKLENASTLAAVMLILHGYYISWFNITLFKHCVVRFGSDNDQEEIAVYETQHLAPYLKRSIFEISSKSFVSSPENTDLVCLYLLIPDEIPLTGQDVEKMRYNLCEMLDIKDRIIQFNGYEPGSTILIFGMPKALICIPSLQTLEKYYIIDLDKKTYTLKNDFLDQILPPEIKESPIHIKTKDVDHIHKMYGHKYKDEADPEIPAGNYSQFFILDVQPLYNTLEGIFNLSEESASFVVNRIFQIIYTHCTKLMISRMTEQLEKLFVQQEELSDIEMEHMTDTGNAFGLLLHGANITEYTCTLRDDIDKVINTKCTESTISKMVKQLQKLFVQQEGRSDIEMKYTENAFGLLLHSTNIKDYQMSDDIVEIMTLLCKYELFCSVAEEMGEELKLLIKQAIDVIQSLVNHVPPLVVDCSPHPDINSGAYPGKKVAGLEAEKYVTTQSALFYSYKGQLVARTGELSSIASISTSKDALAQFWSGFRSENEGKLLKSQFQIEEKSSSEKDHAKATNNSQEETRLLKKDVKYRKDKTCSDEQN